MRVPRMLLVLVLLSAVLGSAPGQEKDPSLSVNVSGLYNAWGLWQRDFLLGRVDYRDQYLVQMLRLNLAFAYGENIKAVTRFDLGQGWWGVDNQQPTYTAGSASALFDNKETNFFLHADQVYLWFRVPSWSTSFNVGRFQWMTGNRLVLDNNYDGVSGTIDIGSSSLSLGWAKISENVDGLSDLPSTSPDQRGHADGRDADLLFAAYKAALGGTSLEFYGMYYNDGSINDSTAHLIDGIFYNRPRFTAQVTSLTVLGISGITTLEKLVLRYEANYLSGKDDIPNTSHAGRFLNTNPLVPDPLKYDINNGSVMGYNILLRADFAVSEPLTLGLVAGLGSGDSDPTSGKGNVNKLRTAGFFYMTEVWEDSIMPDEEGITPQGLGAPNVRAYRELENTTAFQLNGTWRLMPGWSIFASATYLRATQPVFAWTSAGPDLSRSAKDLGTEFDLKTDYKIYSNLTLTLRTGVFIPGTAASYLINGTDRWKQSAYEVKTEITYAFK